MARPSSVRYGHSRRAQYGVFTGYVIAVLGALLGAALLLVSLFDPGAFARLRGFAADLVSPAGAPGALARTESRSLWQNAGDYLDAGSRNTALREEIAAARVRLARVELIEAENRRLKALLDMQESELPPVATARLIGATSSSVRRFAYLPVGRRNGVREGMPVTAPDGLVGRVLESGNRSARVLLLNDPQSLVPVRRDGDDVVAFASGRPDGNLDIRLVNLGVNPLEPGDIFVTSGAGGLFRPGLPVAVATRITRDGAVASMLSNPAATDFVAIEPVWNEELRAAVLSGQLPEDALADELGTSGQAAP